MYAINISDWSTLRDDFTLKIVLLPVVPEDSETVEAEKGRVDGLALKLDCDDERGEAIVWVVRKKYERHELRMYHSNTGGSWKRV